MAVVDTKAWKAFRLGDLFGSALHGNWVNPKLLDEDDAGYCIVSASTVENGVGSVRYACPDSKNLIPSGVITWGKQSPFFAYQTEPTISGQGVYFYKVGALSESAALFLCSVMQAVVASRYNYQDCLIGEKCDNEVVMLPATPDGQPDWVYMDAYMSEVLKKEEVFAEHLASLTAEAVVDGHKLDTNTWRAFHLYDIFQIDMGNKFDRGKMPFGNEVNFVGRTGVNNGVNAVCGFVDDVKPYPAGYVTLALGGTLGACFLQNKPFYTSQNVIVLIPPVEASLLSLQFVSCVIWNTAAKLYSAFSNELNKHVKTDFVFYLPVTSAGEPDWAFMEQYMQQQMDKAEALVEHLDVVWN